MGPCGGIRWFTVGDGQDVGEFLDDIGIQSVFDGFADNDGEP